MVDYYILKTFTVILFFSVNFISCKTNCNDEEYKACRNLYEKYMIQCNQPGYGFSCSNIITSECDSEEQLACDKFKQEHPNVGTCHISNLENNCYTN